MSTPSENDLNFNLSRIDRSVADNLKDIDNSFDGDAQLVLDFLLFMSKKLDKNLFGYTRFTIKEFCEFTGANPVDLCAIHPDIADGKVKPKVYSGHKFETAFEYTLLRMLNTNIVFSKVYDWRDDGKIIKLENFPILKDIYLQSGTIQGTKKVYEVRLSDVIIEGFVQRYYTLDTSRLPTIGRGKGGHSRKKLFVWLNKIFHTYSSRGTEAPLYSVDYLADIAGVRYKRDQDENGELIEKLPKHKKESVDKMLKAISNNVNDKTNKLHFSFSYKFVSHAPSDASIEDYHLKFDFSNNLDFDAMTELATNHKIKITLLRDLRALFDTKYPAERLRMEPSLENEADSFQRWLNNKKADIEQKIYVIKSAYQKAHNFDKKKDLKDNEAMHIIYNGFLSIS